MIDDQAALCQNCAKIIWINDKLLSKGIAVFQANGDGRLRAVPKRLQPAGRLLHQPACKRIHLEIGNLFSSALKAALRQELKYFCKIKRKGEIRILIHLSSNPINVFAHIFHSHFLFLFSSLFPFIEIYLSNIAHTHTHTHTYIYI